MSVDGRADENKGASSVKSLLAPFFMHPREIAESATFLILSIAQEKHRTQPHDAAA
jgi:hypothetical protein